MRDILRSFVGLGLGMVLFGACASDRAFESAASEPRLIIAGEIPRPGTWSTEQLEALGSEDVDWVFRDQRHTYHGLRLDRLLQHVGFEAGPGGASVPPRDRRTGWRRVVIAKARDGFRAVFTCAELMPEMGRTRAYLVWRRDGETLPADEGPLRLIVTTDQKGSRSARQLSELRITDGAGS
ncbi:MAG: molybdopterin-dependent oxidoreductase [Planctomycetota bacterium]